MCPKAKSLSTCVQNCRINFKNFLQKCGVFFLAFSLKSHIYLNTKTVDLFILFIHNYCMGFEIRICIYTHTWNEQSFRDTPSPGYVSGLPPFIPFPLKQPGSRTCWISPKMARIISSSLSHPHWEPLHGVIQTQWLCVSHSNVCLCVLGTEPSSSNMLSFLYHWTIPPALRLIFSKHNLARIGFLFKSA